MNRYIKLSDAIKSIEDLQDCYNGYSDTYDKACIIGTLEELPSVDAVPVVRCSECRFSSNDAEYCDYHRTPTTENRFCSDGRKRA